MWTGAPSAEAVTMSVVFNGAAGLRRRACLDRGSSAEFLGCTLIESEAAREDADVIFQQPLSSTMRSIVFNAPVRYGDRVSFRVKARHDNDSGFFPDADDNAFDSDGVEIEQGGETDESFTLHLEDAGGSRRSNAAATTIRIANIGYIDGPSNIVLDRSAATIVYNWNQDQNPELRDDANSYRISHFGFFYRVEAAALGGPVARECQIATPADFGGAFPTYPTIPVPGGSPISDVGTTTEGGISVTVRAADIVLADSGLCATKYFRVVQDPANEVFDAVFGPRGNSGWGNRVAVHIEPTRLVNCGGGGSGCGGGAEPSSFNAPVSQLVAVTRTPSPSPQAGFLIARLGSDVHPNLDHVTGAAKGDAAAVTGQYLELLHDHYSGGQLVEGASRRFTVVYYGTTLAAPVTVPWHIEGIADADEQFERDAGFVTFPEGLAGGAIVEVRSNIRASISAGALTFPDSPFRYNLRSKGSRRMFSIQGGPIGIQRGIDIAPSNDAVTEGEQSFRVVLGEPVTDGPALAGAGQFAEGVIAASDPIRQVLLDGPATLTPGEASTFTALWGGPAPAADTTVEWQISGDAADAFSDTDGTVMFAQGDDADRTFTLTPMAAATTRTFSVSLTPMVAAATPPDIWRDVPSTLTVGGQVVTTRLPTGVDDQTGVADAIEGYAGVPGEFTVAQSAPPAPPPEPTSSGVNFQLECPDSVAEGEEASCTLTYVGPDPVAQQITITYSIGSTGVNAATCNDFTVPLCGGLSGGMFAPGAAVGTTATLTFQPVADSDPEGDEEFTVTVEPVDIIGQPLSESAATILDNGRVVRIRGQIARAGVAAQSTDVAEGGDMVFDITLARRTTEEVTVAWQVRGGAGAVELADLGDGAGASLADAQAGAAVMFGDVRGFVTTDATAILTGTAVFAEITGMISTQTDTLTTLTVTLPTVADGVREPAEALEMILPPPGGTDYFVAAANATASVVIRSQIAYAGLAARSPAVSEGGDILFDIALTRGTTEAVAVAWQVRGVSGGGRSVELADFGDGDGAPLSAASSGAIAFGDGTGFVVTTGTSAILTGTVVFAAITGAVGTQAETLTVALPAVDDGVYEPAEMLEMILPPPATTAIGYFVGAANATATAAVRIRNEIATAGLVAPARRDVREGAELSFDITLARATTEAVAVAWEVRGAGITPADFGDGAGAPLSAASSGAIAFGAGTGFATTATTAILTGTAVFAATAEFTTRTDTLTLVLPTIDDAVNEAAETLEMLLPAPAAGGAASYAFAANTTATAAVTLHDDDTARISIERIDDDGFVEGPAGVSTGTRTALFRVRADGGPGFRLAETAMVSVLVSGALPGDFRASTPTLVLIPAAAGVASATLVVTATDNDRNEAPRTLLASLGEVRIAGAFEYAEVEAFAVLADDDAITATLAPPQQTVEESGAATLTLTLDRALAAAVSVPYTVSPAQTAGATAADFAEGAALDGVFELAAGATMASVELAVIIDAEAETTETALATLGDAVVPEGVGAIAASTAAAAVRIAQNTAAARTLGVAGILLPTTGPEVLLSRATTETDATAARSFLLDLGAAADAFTTDTMVRWRFEHITTSDSDFGAVTGSVAVTAGNSTQSVAFSIAGDNLNEGAETFRVRLSVDDATTDGGTAIAAPVFTLVDDDHLGLVFRATTGTESVSRAATTTVVESAAATPATILATLTDAEPSGVVTAAFIIGGDGVDAGDYDITTPTGLAASATSGTLVFAQGRTTAVIVLSIRDDDLNEGDEVVRVERGANLAAAGAFRAATASDAAQFIIAASDRVLFAVSAAERRVSEGDAARLVVELGGGALTTTAQLAWRAVITDPTNTSVRDPRRLNTRQQPDLAPPSGVIELAANTTRMEVAIGVARDGREEDDEEVLVTLASDSVMLAPDPARDAADEARFVIAANAGAANFLTWSADTRRAAEGAMPTLTLVLAGRPLDGAAVSASLRLNDAADVAGGAVARTQTLTGLGTQTLSFRILDDDLNEGDETLEVSVRASRDGDEFEVLESMTTLTMTIPMSDPTTITAAAAATAREGEDAVFPLVLSGGRLAEAVTVAWSVTATGALINTATPDDFGDGTATDFPASSFVIEPGNPAPEIRVAIFADTNILEENERFMLQLDSSDPGPPRFSLGGVAAAGEIMGLDRTPPALEALPWLAGQRAIWLVANEDIVAATTATAVMSLPRGTALPGFRVGRGADMAQASAAAAGVGAAYQPPRGIALALDAPLAEDGGNVFVFYDYPGAPAVGVYDEVPMGASRNQMTTQTLVVVRSINGSEDYDGDGLPDAAEIAAGENPLTAGGVAGLPTVTVGRASPAHFAYSGVRANGAAAHLGVRATPPGARLSAWYLSDTFGFEGMYPQFDRNARRYGCERQFPAQFRLPPAQGGCEPVDWENVRAGVDHRVGWLALNAAGLWAVDTGTVSNLPEQVVRRVPEVRMDASRVYANTTQAATVAASHDGAGDDSLVIEFRSSAGADVLRVAAASGGARFATMTSVSATWEIAGMTTSAAVANTDLLWRAGDGFGGLSAASYSLGVVTRTRVDNVGAAQVAPVFGRAALVRGGEVVAVLVAGVSNYRLDVRVANLGDGATVTARDAAGVLTGANAPSVSVADNVASVSFNVPSGAASASTATVAIAMEARNAGGGATTATWVYPVVAAASPLALANDADNDGIADLYDWFDAVTTDDEARRSYGGAALLPVAVADAGVSTATRTEGMLRGHHIRAVSPQHELHIGPATRERLQRRAAEVAAAVAANEEDELRYADFAASRFLSNADGQQEVSYDFEIRGVEPEPAEGGGITGGRAGVIIPLSRDFLDATAGSNLRPVKEGAAADGTGGTGDAATAPAGTREFSRDAADGDYGFAQYIGDINAEDGRCPDAGAYTLGPGRGDCLLLYIVDGGANDDDGARNGVIRDPVRIVRGAPPTGGGRSHGGAFNPLALLILLALSLPRRRRTR
ncbi:MAG: hypothetical protein OXU44_03560 [Gammaproteobacteria bacterium]|nr:hypothetical protein [Gammaproteobacteria bacterium]